VDSYPLFVVTKDWRLDLSCPSQEWFRHGIWDNLPLARLYLTLNLNEQLFSDVIVHQVVSPRGPQNLFWHQTKNAYAELSKFLGLTVSAGKNDSIFLGANKRKCPGANIPLVCPVSIKRVLWLRSMTP
jgi:hypothetical protein